MEKKVKSIARIATLNVRGINSELKKDITALDAYTYNTPIMVLTETHIPEEEHIEEITINTEKEKAEYVLYSVNEQESSYHGTGFIIKKDLQPTFKKISNRVATATIKMRHNKMTVISAYAPTLEKKRKKN